MPSINCHKNNYWLVGSVEIAGLLSGISASLPNSISVSFTQHKNYKNAYDISFNSVNNLFFRKMLVLILGPCILGWYLERVKGFIYIGNSSFLIMNYDQREYEFSKIKKSGRKLVLYLTGSDIRSASKMFELSKKLREPNLGTIQASLDSSFASFEREKFLVKNCSIIERYSDLIFNSKTDQKSYFSKETEPFLYFCPDRIFLDNYLKSSKTVTICHAANEPKLKGTEVIRHTIDRLKNEGFEFDYIELIGKNHSEILSTLEKSHICINELYGYMPGVLSIEAMAKMCVVFTRATYEIESDLGIDSKNAWVSITTKTLYSELKNLISNFEEIRLKAIQGNQWAKKHASESVSGSVLASKLNRI